eukprot:scaffold15275_cov105-Phaeocystis_antarctica.AAC.2
MSDPSRGRDARQRRGAFAESRSSRPSLTTHVRWHQPHSSRDAPVTSSLRPHTSLDEHGHGATPSPLLGRRAVEELRSRGGTSSGQQLSNGTMGGQTGTERIGSEQIGSDRKRGLDAHQTPIFPRCAAYKCR